MPDALPDWTSFIPSAGVVGVLVWLIVRIWHRASVDWQSNVGVLSTLRQEHDARVAEAEARCKVQIDGLDRQLIALRGAVEHALTQLETERAARWKAEDAAAKYRRARGDSDDPG